MQVQLDGTTIRDGDVLRFHYRARALADLALPQGVSYAAQLALSWDEDTIESVRESGTADLAVDDFIAAAVDTGSFELTLSPREVEAMDPTAGAQFRAAAEISSGLTVELVAARAQIVYHGIDGPIPGLGLALIDPPATQVAGAAGDVVEPGEQLDIFSSSAPAQSPAPYTASGSAASVGDVGGGKAVVTIELDHQATDGTPG